MMLTWTVAGDRMLIVHVRENTKSYERLGTVTEHSGRGGPEGKEPTQDGTVTG